MPSAARPTNEVRILIIGSGKMGQAHAQAFRKVPGARVVGIVSRRAEQAAKLAGELNAAGGPHVEHGDNWQELAERLQADACVIAVVPTMNEQFTREVLTAGYHVLAEKPVAFTPEAVLSLADLAAERNLIAMAAVNRRFFASVLSAIETINFYGRLIGVTVMAPAPVAERKAKGQHLPEVCDLWTIAHAIHPVDVVRLAAGDPVDTMGVAAVDLHDGERNLMGMYRFSSGALVSFNNFGSSTDEWEIRLHGDHVEVKLAPLEGGWVRVRGSKPRNLPTSFPNDKGQKLGLVGLATAFITAVREGSPIPYPASDLYDHARSVALAEQLMNAPVAS